MVRFLPMKNEQVKKVSISIAKIILCILKEGGRITYGAFFENSHARRYGFGPRHYHNYYNSLNRLQRKGLIRKKGDIYRLTSQGEKEAFFSKTKIYQCNQDTHEEWDGKWRIILFDIPEKKRRYRDELRAMIKAVGFKEFQKSIWVYPYKVPQFLKEILFEEGIKQYTRLITTKDIEYDKDLRKKFGLT